MCASISSSVDTCLFYFSDSELGFINRWPLRQAPQHNYLGITNNYKELARLNREFKLTFPVSLHV